MAHGFNRKYGSYGNVHGFTAKAEVKSSGSLLGGLFGLAIRIAVLLVAAQVIMAALASSPF